jgi:beta-phosphoglucomutase-like phosphatase (HAD superfamily)
MPLLADLDGTLVNSEPWHKRSERETFAKFGIEIEVADLQPYTGTTLPQMLAGIGERFGKLVPPEEFMEAQIPPFRKYIAESVHLFPDAERLVRRLISPGFLSGKAPADTDHSSPSSQPGQPHPVPPRAAIVTSAMPWYMAAILERFPQLRAAFPVIVTQADVENGKPHPEAFLTAARKLGANPGDCVAVEDSVNGIRSARAAGCRVVGIDREGLGHLSEADKVVASLDELGLLESEYVV